MKLPAIPLVLCLLIHLACGKEKLCEVLASQELPESAKVAALREYKQTWVDHKDQFPNIQQRLQTGAIELIWVVPLGTYDPSIRMPNKNEVALVKVKLPATPSSDLSPIEDEYYKVLLKPRGSVHQKVEQGAFEIANFLNMPRLIPPTVRFNASGKNGVLSYFIDLDKENSNPWNWWKKDTPFDQIEALLEPKSLNDFYTFAYVFGLWDMKWVNTLFVGQSTPYNIMSLDNESLTSAVYKPAGEHFYVCWRQDPTYSSSPYEDLSGIKEQAFVLRKEAIPHHLEELKRFFFNEESVKKLDTEDQQKEAIIKKMTSFLWGKDSVPCLIGKKGLWLQVYADFPNILPPTPKLELLDSTTVLRLKGLKVAQLRNFFQDLEEEKPLFSPYHYESIISRAYLLVEGREK